jgi:hypothetical protein
VPNPISLGAHSGWMDKENMFVYTREIDGTGNPHVKINKADSERQMSHVLCHMWN